jgi:hypothetical protein
MRQRLFDMVTRRWAFALAIVTVMLAITAGLVLTQLPVIGAGGSNSGAMPDAHRRLRAALVFFFTRSGSFRPPVSRFHSSNVWLEIFPWTSSSANFRRCAWLLKGMTHRHSGA